MSDAHCLTVVLLTLRRAPLCVTGEMLSVRMDDTVSNLAPQSLYAYSAVDTPIDSSAVQSYTMGLGITTFGVFIAHRFGSLQSFWSSCGLGPVDGGATAEGPVCSSTAFESWTH
eukprot:scaffold191447_cov37-Prasinocladus_malaysianus.AAC.1